MGLMTPDFTVNIGGQPLTDYLQSLFAADLAAPPKAPPTISMSITDNAGGESDKFNLTFARQGSNRPPAVGDEVLVSFGYRETGLTDMGKFIVDRPSTALSKDGGRTITISASSADMTGKLKEPRSEGYRDRTVDAVVKKIAGRNNLAPVVSKELAGLPVPQADQTQESDLHFLSRIARDLGAVFKVAQGRLLFLVRRGTATASGAALVAHVALATSILSAEWEGGERQAFGCVEACYHDQGQAKRLVETAGSGEPKRRLKKTYATKEQAKRAAESELKEGNASKDTLSVTVVGDPLLRAGDNFEMPPLEAEYEGKWSIEVAEHQLDKSAGFTTTLSLERPQ